MQASISTILLVVAGVIAAAIVTVVVMAQINNEAGNVQDSHIEERAYGALKTESVCEAADGNWVASPKAGKPNCQPKS